jgi:hypothetical protein
MDFRGTPLQEVEALAGMSTNLFLGGFAPKRLPSREMISQYYLTFMKGYSSTLHIKSPLPPFA